MMASNEIVYYSKLSLPHWPLILAATENGFCFLGSLGESVSELEQWLIKYRPQAELLYNEEKLLPYTKQFREYFEGKRTQFTFSLDAYGTPFQKRVWDALLTIPYAETRTYSDIAHHIQQPQAVRAVASAVGKNPVMVVVPCHRVIHKSGSISGYRGSNVMKKRLLKLEKENSRLV